MKHILTESEYKALVPKKQFDELFEAAQQAGKIVSETSFCVRDSYGYCDRCPITHLSLVKG